MARVAHGMALACCLWGLSAVVLAQGTAVAPSPDTLEVESADEGVRFQMEVQAPAPLDDLIKRHADIQRFATLGGLTPSELQRLLALAPQNLRQLLATQGYFSPDIQFTLASSTEVQVVKVVVQPGSQTKVASLKIDWLGDAASAPQAKALRESIESSWGLGVGSAFSQTEWGQAKSLALRTMTLQRYPRASIDSSLADIDSEQAQAHLSLTLNSGPAYAFGDIEVEGDRRYDAAIAQRLVRLAGVQAGTPYDEALLHEAQRRLMTSGYYESAFVLLDMDGDPAQAPVSVRLREARLQKFVAGMGVSTDNGPRLTVEHTHHRLPWLDLRSVSSLQLERDTRTLSAELSRPVDEAGWRWLGAGMVQRQDDKPLITYSQQWRLGRAEEGRALDRAMYVQYDRARVVDQTTTIQEDPNSSVSAHYAWTRRAFDDMVYPTRGHGLSVELGAGLTLSQKQKPYLRARARWQSYFPLAQSSDRPSRWSIRLEGGAIWSQEDTLVPATQRFLAGGEGSVRGYPLRDIGVKRADGVTEPGELLSVASVEWQRPVWREGRRTAWETVLFADAGAVADRVRELDPRVGVGMGMRYRSPVGPLQGDLAYGVERREWRLHMSVGFTF